MFEITEKTSLPTTLLNEKKGAELLRDARLNKSTAFTREERKQFALEGLLPYSVSSQEKQIERIMENLRRKPSDIERYVLLNALQDRNERLFFKTVMTHLEEILPLIYTPTVGQACSEFSHIFRQAKGFTISPDDKGQIKRIFDNWPEKDVRVIVITDGQRILGLGDLGSNGMGIPIGKLVLYSACGGIHPHQCMPIMLDVGTNNQELLDDPLYLGYPHKRIEAPHYFELIEEFVIAVKKKFPEALIQWEDFQTPNAYALLKKYRHRTLCFNDDIQGTAAVALAGIYASTRITGEKFSDLRFMFLGAGSAGAGIAELIVAALKAEGIAEEEARKRTWFVNTHGLVVKKRSDLADHILPFAQEEEQINFTEALKKLKPHVLIGVTGTGGTFTREVIELMSSFHERPVIFALSNPTSKSECTALQAYEWSKGKAVFASGSPFGEINFNGKLFRPGQGNNAYIFPGMGLSVLHSKPNYVPEDFFFLAARMLAEMVHEEDLEAGSVYPPLKRIREISLAIATAVCEKAYQMGLAQAPKPADVKKSIAAYMYDPSY